MITHRFVAGVRCPQCGVLDRTYVEFDGAHRYRRRHCQACGLEDSIQVASSDSPDNGEVTAVRLIPDDLRDDPRDDLRDDMGREGEQDRSDNGGKRGPGRSI